MRRIAGTWIFMLLALQLYAQEQVDTAEKFKKLFLNKCIAKAQQKGAADAEALCNCSLNKALETLDKKGMSLKEMPDKEALEIFTKALADAIAVDCAAYAK